jgi:hypothetical protein
MSNHWHLPTQGMSFSIINHVFANTNVHENYGADLSDCDMSWNELEGM